MLRRSAHENRDILFITDGTKMVVAFATISYQGSIRYNKSKFKFQLLYRSHWKLANAIETQQRSECFADQHMKIGIFFSLPTKQRWS